MSLYKGMNAETLEAEYHLTKRRDADPALEDFPLVVERWLERSAKHRQASGAQLDIAYGNGEREKLDYFYSGDANGPLLFIFTEAIGSVVIKACTALSQKLLLLTVSQLQLSITISLHQCVWVRYLLKFVKPLLGVIKMRIN